MFPKSLTNKPQNDSEWRNPHKNSVTWRSWFQSWPSWWLVCHAMAMLADAAVQFVPGPSKDLDPQLRGSTWFNHMVVSIVMGVPPGIIHWWNVPEGKPSSYGGSLFLWRSRHPLIPGGPLQIGCRHLPSWGNQLGIWHEFTINIAMQRWGGVSHFSTNMHWGSKTIKTVAWRIGGFTYGFTRKGQKWSTFIDSSYDWPFMRNLRCRSRIKTSIRGFFCEGC